MNDTCEKCHGELSPREKKVPILRPREYKSNFMCRMCFSDWCYENGVCEGCLESQKQCDCSEHNSPEYLARRVKKEASEYIKLWKIK